MPKLLSDKKKPGSCKVVNIQGEQASRLLEMGITPGIELKIIRTAPLGFPIEIKIRGYLLSLRESEARCILIED
ncbi:ferrous iron transport protein A [Balneola sp. MJW-20]|uniref:FeoA family protein n=1 Tax=Gracilimonas aurantiaca TaxID=3234185 RepID=UPI0034654A4C